MQDTTSQNPTKGRLSQEFIAQINPSGLSDVPTAQDRIGFRPYVRAIAWFLSDAETKPPLTVSIEGPWGSGKSSFMLQLEEELKAQELPDNRQHYIRFNAWRSDKDEALWAAFALTFMKQLEGQIDWNRRIRSNFDLLFRRIEWRKDWFTLVKFILISILFVVLTIYVLFNSSIVKDPGVTTVVLGAPWLAILLFALEKSRKLFGNPLSYDLANCVRNLKYEEKVAFIDRFQLDFSDIVKSYAGEKAKIFVFIDDLDRCEVPKAAELLQAINLLLSTDQGNLFFVLGLDREMVAAGIAAKNEKILPYLAAGRVHRADKTDFYQVGIDYGYTFMEKFIQVPFRVPRPAENEINGWITGLTGTEDEMAPTTGSSGGQVLEIQAGADPEQFQEVVQRMADLFEFNPRRLKQFINLFRLRVMIALSTNVLIPVPQSAGGSSGRVGLTVPQLGLFTALLLRWSQLAGDLMQRPDLFTRLAQMDTSDDVVMKWISNSKLLQAIRLDQVYSLAEVDLRPLLLIMPDTYAGLLGERNPNQPKTLLIGAAILHADPSAERGGLEGVGDAIDRSQASSPPDSLESIPPSPVGPSVATSVLESPASPGVTAGSSIGLSSRPSR